MRTIRKGTWVHTSWLIIFDVLFFAGIILVQIFFNHNATLRCDIESAATYFCIPLMLFCEILMVVVIGSPWETDRETARVYRSNVAILEVIDTGHKMILSTRKTTTKFSIHLDLNSFNSMN